MGQKDIQTNTLEHIHDHHKRWMGKCGVFSILGALPMDVSSMRVTLSIERIDTPKQRLKLDLYDYAQIVRKTTLLSEEQGFNYVDLETDFLALTDVLETYREDIFKQAYSDTEVRRVSRLLLTDEKKYIKLLQKKNLLSFVNQQLGKIGIAGEEQNRLMLFVIGTSYKHQPLHALIQSSSGSGKSHLINTIAECMPQEDVLSFSRITSKSLYHFKPEALNNKLLVIQDFDGLDAEALYAFRELQSYGKLTSSITGKDAYGNHSAKLHTVNGHFASFGASTKDVYTDNKSRSVLLKVDESLEQTDTILSYNSPRYEIITKTKNELQNMVRLLKTETIINSFRHKLSLDGHIPMARRLNHQLNQCIEQITFLHQYQRERDRENRIITTREDVETGIKLFSECLWMKVDELDPSTRHFFEQLKAYIKSKPEDASKKVFSFTQREIRHALHIAKTSLQRSFASLLELEYLEIVSGSKNRGFRYALQYTDDTETLKNKLTSGLRERIKS